jgi:hypothetical protein
MGDTCCKRSSERPPVQTIVVLNRNTTWRCGKLEKSIVNHLYKRYRNFGRPGESINDIMLNLNLTGEKTDSCIDALLRLEKRNIVTITPL